MCTQVDPENPLCQVPPLPPLTPLLLSPPQVLGKYSLRLDSQPGVLPRYNYLQPKVSLPSSPPVLLAALPSGGDVGELSQPGSGLPRPHQLLAQHTHKLAMESPWHALFTYQISRTKAVYEYDIASVLSHI